MGVLEHFFKALKWQVAATSSLQDFEVILNWDAAFYSKDTVMDASATAETPRAKLEYPFEDRPDGGELVEVAPGVFWLSMPLPFDLKFINLWLIEGNNGWTIVDTGIGDQTTEDLWESIFAKYLKGKPVNRVIVTHMHPDHFGMAGWLTRRWDCPLYMSRGEYMQGRVLVADTGRQAPEEGIRFYRAAAWNDEHIDRYKRRFGNFGQAVTPIPEAYVRLEDGQSLQIGDREWRVIMGSGHSPEHACLYCPELNVVITGDQLLPRISSNVSVHPTEPEADPLAEWLDSCAKLKRELPEDVLCLPAHNKPFRGAHRRLDNLIGAHERSLGRLLELLEAPVTVPDTFRLLFFRKIDKHSISLATGEAIAHLNCLMHRGKVKRSLRDGVHVYERYAEPQA